MFLKQYNLRDNGGVMISVNNRLGEPGKFFYYIQVHAYLHEVTLSWSRNDSAYERGTNVGLIFMQENELDQNRSMFLANPSEDRTVSVMIALLVYEIDKTPIPGYCSQISNYIRPNLKTTTLPDTISTVLTGGKGLAKSGGCDVKNSSLSYEFRFIYFGKNEYFPDVYFATVTKFLVAGRAQDFGEVFVGKVDPKHENRRLFCRYAGMGLFFVAILRDTSNDSFIPISYVPSVSYGCPGPVLDEIHCDLIGGTIFGFLIFLSLQY